jgi:hypothetical protein
MTTAGRHGFLDALFGSTMERVLHSGAYPLLAIPPDQEQQTIMASES